MTLGPCCYLALRAHTDGQTDATEFIISLLQWPCTIEIAPVDLGRPYPGSFKQEIPAKRGQKGRSRSCTAIEAMRSIISVYQLIKTWLRFFLLTLVNLNSHWKLLEHGVLQSTGWQSHSHAHSALTDSQHQSVTRPWSLQDLHKLI